LEKIIIFKTGGIVNLQTKINKWLEENYEKIEIISRKFSSHYDIDTKRNLYILIYSYRLLDSPPSSSAETTIQDFEVTILEKE
jgi:hypothetical protein